MAIGLVCLSAASTAVFAQTRAAGYSTSNESGYYKRNWDYDGERILGHIGPDAYLWDARTGEILHRLTGHGENVYSVRFSPDGETAMTTSWNRPGELSFMPERQSKDTSVRIWDIQNGRELQHFANELGGVFAPDGKHIVTFSMATPTQTSANGIALWDTRSGEQRFATSVPNWVSPLLYANEEIRFSPDGRELIFLASGQIIVWEADTGSPIGQILQHGPETAIFGGRQGLITTFGHGDAGIEDWNLETGERTRHLPILSKGDLFPPGWLAAWSRDGIRVIGVSPSESVVRVWDAASGEVLGEVSCPRCGYVPHVRLSLDGRLFLVEWMPEREQRHDDGTVSGQNRPGGFGLFDAYTGQPIAEVDIPAWGRVVGFSPNGETLLVGGSTFIVYRTDTAEPLVQFDLLPGGARSQEW